MLNKQQIKSIKAIEGWDEFVKIVPPPSQRKGELLAMAKRGEPRPSYKDWLGESLGRYTNKNTSTYDPKFNKEIRRLAPHWFIDKIAEKKKQLIEMAKRGDSRPSDPTSPLKQALSRYTSKNSTAYYPEFDKEIRQLAPQWFIDTTAKKKKQLIAMAKRGEPKPKVIDHLGSALKSYTSPKNNSYNPEFDKEIRRLAPQWFVKTSDEKKKQLLAMAKNGDPRPTVRSHPLGSSLLCYTNKNKGTYDPKFNKEIRRSAPQWFIDKIAEKKKQLIAMAKSGDPKPPFGKHLLGEPLCRYTSKRHCLYDSEFDKEIKKLAPHWFKKAA